MNTKIICSLAFSVISATSHADGIKEFEIPFGNKLPVRGLDGSVTVDLDTTLKSAPNKIEKKFYGAGLQGFSKFPKASLVTPLQLGLVKMGGNLHSTYNWETNAYYDSHDNGVFYVYAPLERRVRMIQQAYNADPMFQINMMGWQPTNSDAGNYSNGFIYDESANAQHAADAITYLNGEKQLAVKNIVMDNEPFLWKDTHGKYSPSADEYIAKYIEYVVAMRAAQENITQDPNDIKIWGPEIATGWTGFQTNNPKDCVVDYNLPEKVKCSYGNGMFTEFIPYFLYKITQFENDSTLNPRHYKMLDVLTFHYYPLFRTTFEDKNSILVDKNGKQDVKSMLESVNLWNVADYINKYDSASPKGVSPKILNKYKAWRDQYYPSAKIALTEYGIDSVPGIEYHPIVSPLYLADLMARLASEGIDAFVNSFLQSGEIAEGWAMITNDYKTRQYYIYSLYSNFFLGRLTKTTDSFGDLVNVYTSNTENATNVFLVNKDAKENTTDVKFKTSSTESKVAEIALPAWSLTVLTVPHSRGGQIQVRQYGAAEMGIAVDNNNEVK